MFFEDLIFSPVEDLDLDGIADTGITEVDTDGDGIFDTQVIMTDIDGDGVPDLFTAVSEVDDADSGLFDPYSNYNGGNIDSPFHINQTGQVEAGLFETDSNLPTFNQDEAYARNDVVIGEPAEDMTHWELQPESGPCAIYSQMFALEELTGQEFDINQLINVAEENGWYDPDGGTPINCMGNILEYYGLDVNNHGNGTIDDIQNCLQQGGKIIVAVDGDEIWYNDHDTSIFSPGDPNHAVEVIGVDYDANGQAMVILNDSGTPDGRGEMVPLEQFMNAWQDSGCSMVEVYPNA